MMLRFSYLMILYGLVAGCASVPQPLLQEGAVSELTPNSAQTENVIGTKIRWGGTILDVKTSTDETCFEILSFPLDRTGRPEESDDSRGRFIACDAGFYDPAVYAQGREMTVIGKIEQLIQAKVGEYDYRYPKVAIEKLYLWPKPYVFRDRYVEPLPWGWPYRRSIRDRYYGSWPFWY
jgi:outer membrane lipoprotein